METASYYPEHAVVNVPSIIDGKPRSRSRIAGVACVAGGALSMGVSNAASSGKSALQRRLQKPGSSGLARKEGDTGHVTIVEPEEGRRRKQDGFLIRFKL